MISRRRLLALFPLLILLGIVPIVDAAVLEQPARLQDEQNTIDIINQFRPSVVSVDIVVSGDRIAMENHPDEGPGGGSGFVIDRKCRIVTNYHVVAGALQENSIELLEGAEIKIRFAGAPDKQFRARVLGAMLDYDLAMLELIERKGLPKGVVPITLGDSTTLEVGQKVIAIGNPFELQSSVTTGIVSGIEREGPSIFGTTIPYIQTDAAINPGNSGGPLLNSQGELIGINNAILSPNGTFAGISFAVPSELLRRSLEDLRAGGLSGLIAKITRPTQPRLGIQSEVSLDEYPEFLKKNLGLPERGAVITAIVEGSPAAAVGLREPRYAVMTDEELLPGGSDIIVAVDGTPVGSALDIQSLLVDREVGEKVRLTVWRDGEQKELSVPLELLDAAASAPSS